MAWDWQTEVGQRLAGLGVGPVDRALDELLGVPSYIVTVGGQEVGRLVCMMGEDGGVEWGLAWGDGGVEKPGDRQEAADLLALKIVGASKPSP